MFELIEGLAFINILVSTLLDIMYYDYSRSQQQTGYECFVNWIFYF